MNSGTAKFQLMNFGRSYYVEDLGNAYQLKIIKLIFNIKMVNYKFSSGVLYPIDCGEYQDAILSLRTEREYTFNGCRFKIDLTAKSSFVFYAINKIRESLGIDNENKRIIFLAILSLVCFAIYSAGAFKIKVFSINRKFDLDKIIIREHIATKSIFYNYLKELDKHLENEDDC
jgi:hypothetical protein